MSENKIKTAEEVIKLINELANIRAGNGVTGFDQHVIDARNYIVASVQRELALGNKIVELQKTISTLESRLAEAERVIQEALDRLHEPETHKSWTATVLGAYLDNRRQLAEAKRGGK